ncbi:hypothetical protein BD289DRAFT_478352 [Coniella lustricola]|uniref:S-adenosylmethionine-dependent methyltransferase-like protein n=1 Tax=Coniella lustricola TaxID=2025994 RepID=A0A2T3AN81_9PEZI|nr:hypothetical protein BD289DRAFT_478352 [Coniella lustricola]
MPFGRSQRQNNPSQHTVAVESAGPAAGPQSVQSVQSAAAVAGPGSLSPAHNPQNSALGPGPAISHSPLSTHEAFAQPDLRAVSGSLSHSQQLPPVAATPQQQLYSLNASSASPQALTDLALNRPQGVNNNITTTTTNNNDQQLQPLNANTHTSAATEAKVRRAASDFVDAVARSQSHRYNQVSTPVQANPSYGTSYTDLSKALQADPQSQHPFAAYQQQQQHHNHQQPQQQAAPVEPRRSTRRLIRNILAGSSKSDQSRSDLSFQSSQSHSYYDGASGPGRRSSKRLSNPNPPILRTGPSQVSLEQPPPLDWQSQGPPSQPSPLQNSSHEFQQSTLRRVPTGQEQSPYSEVDETSFHQQLQHSPEHQQQHGQVTFDPATRQYQLVAHQSHQFPQSPQNSDGSGFAYSGHLGTEHLQNTETVSQVSRDSPIIEGEPQTSSSIPSTAVSPGARYSQQQDFPSRTSSLQPHQGQPIVPPQQEDAEQHNTMAPPSSGSSQARRQENDKTLRGEVSQGPPPGYRHSQQASNSINTMPAGAAAAGAGQSNFRQSTIQERPPPQYDGAATAAEHDRNSPQPTEDPEKAFKDLLTKYKNVKRLYFDGKTQIETLNGQVEQLQNAVANQRISQSRTALDDNEYTTRFNRLNGAINNLSFNIRKDWKSLPDWITKYVSADALKTGKQEMTAVGRAVITSWLVHEIFYGCFHPGLDPELSRSLKQVEQNIRRFSYTMTSQEEFDALTSKVLSWRMTTLEGLQDVLQSTESANHRQEFTRKATASLTGYIFRHLTDPPPAGVDGSASMIVELAVGIAANLPLESRDVSIIYPQPEDPIQPDFMDVEKTGLPVIETRPPDSEGDSDSRGEDAGKESGGEKASSSSKERNKSRAGTSAISTLSNIFGSAPASFVPGSATRKDSSLLPQPSATFGAPTTSTATSFTDSSTNIALPPKGTNRVRFAGFLAVDVRGRQVLVKAPVWTLA